MSITGKIIRTGSSIRRMEGFVPPIIPIINRKKEESRVSSGTHYDELKGEIGEITPKLMDLVCSVGLDAASESIDSFVDTLELSLTTLIGSDFDAYLVDLFRFALETKNRNKLELVLISLPPKTSASFRKYAEKFMNDDIDEISTEEE